MTEDLRLFINDKEVEFTTGPKILYNYKLTDLTNPTIVKNSYSKSIEIPGTNRNNDIFGHIWNLERVQYYSTGGVGFNPLQKTPFTLYVNGNLIEKGYCKLEKITKKGGQLTYSVQLYGGLGSFLYSLAYDESQNDERHRTLADLKFDYDETGWPIPEPPSLDFRINKDTVADAWVYLGGVWPDDHSFVPSGDSDKWRVINFAPCYNGLPEDFDSDKVLNNQSAITNSILQKQSGTGTTAGIAYRTVLNGQRIPVTASTSPAAYSFGEIGEEVTEWETKDLRSYLQRPVVNVARVINACKNPEINGGYEFKLGERFFNAHKNQFYYSNAWMTLPMLKDLEIEGGQEAEITGATMTSGSDVNTRWTLEFTTPQGLGQVNGARVTIEPRLIVDSGESQPNELHFSRYWYSNSNCINPKSIKKYYCENAYIIQLIGRNTNGEIVSQSKAYYFSEAQKFPNGESVTKYFWSKEDEGTKPEYEWMKGYFKKVGGEYRFCNDNGQYVAVDFDIPAGKEIAMLEFKTMTIFGVGYEAKWDAIPSVDIKPIEDSVAHLYNSKKRTGGGCYEPDEVINAGRTNARIVPYLASFYGKALDYESMFSNKLITKEKLLSTPFTPADFLLSYAKMFGLYFYYDPVEVSDDPDTYPNGVVHLLDRVEYYQMWNSDEERYQNPQVENLEMLIDRSKEIKITPIMAESKFYRFEQEPIESEGNTGYYDTYGHNYGRQLVNTGYNFDNGTKDLYDTNVFKSALMCLEKDKYFKQTVDNVEPFVVNGRFKYYLYGDNLDDTKELAVAVNSNGGRLNPNSALTGYDLVAKMQFHNANNEASDGAYVLCTYYGTAGCMSSGHYYITDDVSDMIYLNGGNPCWLMTPNDFVRGGARIAWHIPSIPVFTRDQWNNYESKDGVVVNSWNFGHPKEILCPFTYTSEGDSIYDKYWKDYIGDLYSLDTRKLTCYVNLLESPSQGTMRKFYWFDNSIWRLNEVKDWNVFGFDSTLCEFIKVMDTKDYRIPQPSRVGIIELFATPTVVPHSGGNVTISIKNQTGDFLWTEDDDFYIYGDGSEGGSYTIGPVLPGTAVSGTYISFTVEVPECPVNEEVEWQFSVEDDADDWHWITFKQLRDPESTSNP